MGVEVPIHIHYPPYLPGCNIEVTDRMWRVSRDEINASPNNCPESSVFQQRHTPPRTRCHLPDPWRSHDPIEWTPGTGTYQVNADCTGTAHIATSTGGFVNLVFVVVSQGKQINSVVTAPFDGLDRDVTSVGIKVE
jgi:hypothetical protein